jgi:hypothetical protein
VALCMLSYHHDIDSPETESISDYLFFFHSISTSKRVDWSALARLFYILGFDLCAVILDRSCDVSLELCSDMKIDGNT